MEALFLSAIVLSFSFGFFFLGKDQSLFVKTLLGVSGVILTPFVIGSIPVLLPEIVRDLRSNAEPDSELAFA